MQYIALLVSNFSTHMTPILFSIATACTTLIIGAVRFTIIKAFHRSRSHFQILAVYLIPMTYLKPTRSMVVTVVVQLSDIV